MKKILMNKRGISLIVLVITIIIIMIILATSVILSLSSSNVISKATKSKVMNNFSSVEERRNFLQAEMLLGKTPNLPEKIDNYRLEYNISKERIDILYVDEIAKAIIPDGFSHAEGTISTGLVIKDAEGNEFVWIPINDYDEDFVYLASRESIYIEPYSGYSEEVNLYNAICNSVKEYKGFYISRYDIKDELAELNRTLNSEGGKPVSKKDGYLYNFVSYSGNPFSSKQLAGNMYNSNNSVVSHLPFGIEWDAMLKFVNSDEQTGNVRKNVFTEENIYYWTQEYENVLNTRITRRAFDEARYDGLSGTTKHELISFKIALYIK